MKLHPDTIQAQSISGYGADWISVGTEKITNSVVLASGGERFDWNCTNFAQLTERHFAQLANLQTELVIFGSGKQIRFPQGAWIKSLIEKRIGIETMDTQAACRTYNILASEGRKVAVALLLEKTEG